MAAIWTKQQQKSLWEMWWIKDSFFRTKYSLAHFLKRTTMHGLSKRPQKEDLLLWDQNM